MHALKNRCRYKSYSCAEPPIKDGLCIFHIPKLWKKHADGIAPPENKVFIEDVEEEFKEALKELVTRFRKIKKYEFEGFHFPPIAFQKKVFYGPVNCRNTHFHGRSDFDEARFEDTVDFYAAVFQEQFRSYKVTFKGQAFFLRTRFLKGADFSEATYHAKARFMGCTFEGGATHFIEAVLKDGAVFSLNTFEGEVFFDQAICNGHTSFTGNDKNACFKNYGRFLSATLEKDAALEFNKVDLSRMSFINTNLERLKFRGVKWYAPPDRPRRKQALWDEFAPDTRKDSYTYIAENYAQLVINSEKIRDYTSAEDFHIGEMEMRRKVVEGARKYLSRINSFRLYRFLSTYGTNYVRAFWVFVGAFLLCSLGFLFTGLQVKHGDTVSVIRHVLSPELSLAGIGHFLANYIRSLGFTFAVLTLQRDYPIQPLGSCSHVWQGLFSLLLAGQAAMVLLAIRRQFKR